MQRRAEMLKRIEKQLHDLCQPLTTLQCRLELGAMCADGASLLEAVQGGLQETEKLFAGIGAMRESLQREMSRMHESEDVEE